MDVVGTLTLVIAPPPALTITSPAAITGTAGQQISYTVTANRDLDPVNWIGLTTTPNAGFLAVTGTHLIQGTPPAPGVYGFTVTANPAGGGAGATQSVTLTVSGDGGGGGPPPVGVAITDETKAAATLTLGGAFSRALAATDGGPLPLWSLSGAPAWLTLTGGHSDASRNTLSGTPTAAGVYQATLHVSGADGTTDTAALVITVEAAPGGGTAGIPVLQSPATAVATVGAAFTFAVLATNSPTAYGAAGLPAWLALDAATGVISGTPTTAAGEVAITVSATNAAGTVSAPLRLSVVAVVPPPVLDGPFYASAPAGQPFFFTVTSTPAAASYAAAGLPAGLACSAAGSISGTPLPGATGQITVTLTATDAQGRKGTGALVIDIPPARNYPAAGSGAAPYAPEELCFNLHSESKQGLLRDFTGRTTRSLGTFLRNEGVPYVVRLVQESRTNYRTFDDVDPTGAQVFFAIGNAEETPWVAASSTTALPAADFSLSTLRAGTPNTTAVQRLALLHHPYDGTFEFEGRTIPHDATGDEFTAALGPGWSVVSGGAHTWDIARTRPGAYGPSAVDVSGIIVPAGFLVEFDFDTQELIAAFQATDAEEIEGICEGSVVFGSSLPKKFFRQGVAIARSVLDPTQPDPVSVEQYPPANTVAVRATDAEAAAGTSNEHAPSVRQVADYVAAHAAPRSTTMGCVVHNAVATVARPPGYAAVTWIGSVAPANALDHDLWEQTA